MAMQHPKHYTTGASLVLHTGYCLTFKYIYNQNFRKQALLLFFGFGGIAGFKCLYKTLCFLFEIDITISFVLFFLFNTGILLTRAEMPIFYTRLKFVLNCFCESGNSLTN